MSVSRPLWRAAAGLAVGVFAAGLTCGSYELVNDGLTSAMLRASKGEEAAAVQTATTEAVDRVRARLVGAIDRVDLLRVEVAAREADTSPSASPAPATPPQPGGEEEKRRREEAEREAIAAKVSADAEAEARKLEVRRLKAKLRRVQVSPGRRLAAFIGEEPARDLLVLRMWVERRPVETLDLLVAEQLAPLHLDPDLQRRVQALARRQDKDHAELLDLLGRTKTAIDARTNMWPIGSPARVSVIVNGWIQLATVFVFWVGLMLTGYLLWRISRWGADPVLPNGSKMALTAWLADGASSIHHHAQTRPGTIAHASSDAQRAAELVRLFKQIHEEPPLTTTCHAVLLAGGLSGSSEAMASALERCVTTLRDDAEAALELPRYAAWLIPSLGFVGTVVGIGNGLLNADRMITAPREQQGQEIARITGYLGFAFDTTLVALVLSAVVVLLIHAVHTSTESQVEWIRAVVKRLILDRYLPTPPEPPAPQTRPGLPALPGGGL